MRDNKGNCLSATLLKNKILRIVESDIYSVLASDEAGNEYDSQFGFVYDLVACNPIYNRLIWGYSVKIYPKITDDALCSSKDGSVLDLGCGSLAFTKKVYIQHKDRPVVLADKSLKMLRMAKHRLIKQNGKVPDNLIFLHVDALHLPFQKNAFTTIISENLLHCLNDTNQLLERLKNILVTGGKMYFTTLVKGNRWADKYLQALADSGKLISRSVDDHKEIFNNIGLAAKHETRGNMLSIECEKQ
jgi:ubiquinone/menaquinone biosynthesis C-methylase UbiE